MSAKIIWEVEVIYPQNVPPEEMARRKAAFLDVLRRQKIKNDHRKIMEMEEKGIELLPDQN